MCAYALSNGEGKNVHERNLCAINPFNTLFLSRLVTSHKLVSNQERTSYTWKHSRASSFVFRYSVGSSCRRWSVRSACISLIVRSTSSTCRCPWLLAGHSHLLSSEGKLLMVSTLCFLLRVAYLSSQWFFY